MFICFVVEAAFIEAYQKQLNTYFFPSLRALAFSLDIVGVAVILWELYSESITMSFLVVYNDFREGINMDKWEKRLPYYTYRRDPDSVEFSLSSDELLDIIVLKRDVGFQKALKWEGPEISSKGEGYNLVMVKVMLDFDKSTSENGNICLYGYGRSGRFHYLIGIDKKTRDIFYHLWEKRRARGEFDLGDYIEERGRTHLKNYLDGPGEKWVTFGLEWDFDGPKYFAFSEEDKDIVKIPAVPPPQLRKDLISDSRSIYLFGLKEFGIRVNLATDFKDEKRSIVGSLSFVKVKSAPLHWLYYLKRIFRMCLAYLKEA